MENNDSNTIDAFKPPSVVNVTSTSIYKTTLRFIALSHICCFSIELILRRLRFWYPDPYFNRLSDISILFFYAWILLGIAGIMLTIFCLLKREPISTAILVWGLMAIGVMGKFVVEFMLFLS